MENGNNNNNNLSNLYANPQFLAGLAMMRGTPADQAFTEAILRTQKIQEAQMQQQQYQRQQYAQQMLPQIAQQLAGLSPQEAFGKLVETGLDPKEAIAITEILNKNNAKKMETFTGPGNVRYATKLNEETGELEAMPLPGQLSQDSAPPSNAEIRINATQISKLNNDANRAQKELRLLEDSDKAFEQFDKNAGSLTEAGSIASKILPTTLENVAYNKKAQTAKQEIDKLNSQLYQNRIAMLGSSATDAAKEQIRKGLPTTGLTPEARKELLNSKKRENYEQILRAKFYNQWYQKNNKNLVGAEDAFNELINSSELLDENGQINKNLLNDITQQKKIGDTKMLNNFESIALEDLIAEKRRRSGMQ